MPHTVTPIRLRFIFDVNCYLVTVDGGYVLIDTGLARRREALRERLSGAGCEPGDLRLIVLTHAHTDHAGNCAYLRETYGAPIGMHADEVGKTERGDMFWTEAGTRALTTTVVGSVLSAMGLGRFDAFSPDVLLGDGQGLGEYGFDATVFHLPGHSAGSIGVLDSDGSMFCGDLLTNSKRPEPNSLAEDESSLRASADRLAGLGARMVYPGHGAPFLLGELTGAASIG